VLHKCANPVCSAQFRHLLQGKLFEVETRYVTSIDDQGTSRNVREHVERYWLCDECAADITLRFDRERGMIGVSSLRGLKKATMTAIPQSVPRAAAGIAMVLIRPFAIGWTGHRESKKQMKARRSLKVA